MAWVAIQALQPVLDTLGATLLSTPDLTGNDRVTGIWTTSLITANGIFVLFIVTNGFLVAARETLQTQHGLQQVLPRIAIGAVAANASLLICHKAIEATNALTMAIAGTGVDNSTAAAAISRIVSNTLQGDTFLQTLLALAVIVLCLVVIITFVLRLACLVLLIGIAPLALMCHSSPLTEGAAHLWWRAFGACLGLQLGQAVIVLGTVKVFLTPSGPAIPGVPAGGDLFGILVCLAMLWVLVKMPGWTRQFILGPLGQRRGRGILGQLVYAFVTIKTLGTAASLIHGVGSAGTAARSGSGARGPRPSPAYPNTSGPSRRPSPPRPAPAGPVMFSHAPAVHATMPAPSGTATGAQFSHPIGAAAAVPASTQGTPVAPFSHQAAAHTTGPRPAASAPRVAFSHTTAGPPKPARSGRAPTVTFSAAATPQSAPRRPAAPIKPVFSSPPTEPPPRPTINTPRPTAARRTSPPD